MGKSTLQKMRKSQVELERSLWKKCKGESCEFCLHWAVIKHIRYEGQKLGTCDIVMEKKVEMAGNCCDKWQQFPEVE